MWKLVCFYFITYGIRASRVVKLSVNIDKLGDLKEREGGESDDYWFLKLGNKLMGNGDNT